jgi:hypothetical protein
MNPAQIRCPGCDWLFSPLGLAHHLSKTLDSCSYVFHTSSQTQSISGSAPQMPFSPALAPIRASDISDGDVPGLIFNEGPELEQQLDAGEFIVVQLPLQGVAQAHAQKANNHFCASAIAALKCL